MASNIELVETAFAAVRAGDVEAFVATLHEDVEFLSITARLNGAGPYRGHDGIREWDRDRRATWALDVEPTHFLEQGDRVLIRARVRTTGAGSGLALDTPTSWVVTIRGDRIARIEGFTDEAEAEAAFA
jgi:ketosteroid isomerase-like protein